jgi:hypothetical protein
VKQARQRALWLKLGACVPLQCSAEKVCAVLIVFICLSKQQFAQHQSLYRPTNGIGHLLSARPHSKSDTCKTVVQGHSQRGADFERADSTKRSKSQYGQKKKRQRILARVPSTCLLKHRFCWSKNSSRKRLQVFPSFCLSSNLGRQPKTLCQQSRVKGPTRS